MPQVALSIPSRPGDEREPSLVHFAATSLPPALSIFRRFTENEPRPCDESFFRMTRYDNCSYGMPMRKPLSTPRDILYANSDQQKPRSNGLYSYVHPRGRHDVAGVVAERPLERTFRAVLGPYEHGTLPAEACPTCLGVSDGHERSSAVLTSAILSPGAGRTPARADSFFRSMARESSLGGGADSHPVDGANWCGAAQDEPTSGATEPKVEPLPPMRSLTKTLPFPIEFPASAEPTKQESPSAKLRTSCTNVPVSPPSTPSFDYLDDRAVVRGLYLRTSPSSGADSRGGAQMNLNQRSLTFLLAAAAVALGALLFAALWQR